MTLSKVSFFAAINDNDKILFQMEYGIESYLAKHDGKGA